MAEKTMSSPTVIINNDVISVVPNSVSYKNGAGERKVKTASAGGRSVEIINTYDAGTLIGMLKFKLYTTKRNIDLLNDWVNRSIDANNTATLNDGTFVTNFTEMCVVNDPEVATGVDGEIEVEFQGRGSI